MNIKDAIKYTSAIRPNQYSIGKVEAPDFKYLIREKILYVVSLTRSSDKTRRYKTQLAFKGVKLSDQQTDQHPIPYYNDKGQLVGFIPIMTVDYEIMTRCQCDDYRFMWSFWNKKEKGLIGPVIPYTRVPGSNRPPVNPDESPGLCKHQLGLIKKLMESGVIKKDVLVWNYLNRPVRPSA